MRRDRALFVGLLLICGVLSWRGADAGEFVYPVGSPDIRPRPDAASLLDNGYIVTRRYKESVDGVRHTGVDLANGQEGGEVRSIAAGTVAYVQEQPLVGFGNLIRITHSIPGIGTVYSQYAHLQNGSIRVALGDWVQAGTIIGAVDCTGATNGTSVCASNGRSGPHLHFAIQIMNRNGCGYLPDARCPNDTFALYFDPLQFIDDQGTAQGVRLTKTGQTTSFSPGDDGDLQKGVAWPVPRFTDHGDGTVTDNLTGLMWTRDAGLATPIPAGFDTQVVLAQALQFVAEMNAGVRPNFGHTDWRLPNILELRSLADHGRSLPALPGGHPFVNARTGFNDNYASSTSTSDCFGVFALHMLNGGAIVPSPFSNNHAWPTRAGENGVIGLRKTGQIISCIASDDGNLQRGASWPVPRFTDHGDGTVTDNLTRLIWTKDADLGGLSLTWQEALQFVAEMNAGVRPNFGHTDWRLPNVNELQSLMDLGRRAPALPDGHPFAGVQSNFFWSSTTDASATTGAWLVHMGDGAVGSGTKGGAPFGQGTWPVR